MLRLLRNFELKRTLSTKAAPLPETNPPVLYSGVSQINDINIY